MWTSSSGSRFGQRIGSIVCRTHRTSAIHPDGLAQVVAALNAHADKLNARLFSSMDYVVIARR